MRTIFKLMCAALLGTGVAPNVSAQTDGTATFNVQLANNSGTFTPKHVVAVWVSSPSGTFVKTVWKDGSGWSGEGTSHLNQWQAARGGSQFLDGHSSSTITTFNPMTVTWNCRNTNNVLMADGTYKFWVEFTESNSQGPYTSGGISWTKSSNVYSNNYADQTYIKNLKVVFTPAIIPHDLAALSISPSAVSTNAIATIRVAVTNKTTTAEAFSVLLSNVTTATLIGTQPVSSLAGNALTNVPFSWNTAGLLGPYTLQGVVGAVTSETSTNDNTISASVSVQYIPHDLAVTRLTPNLVAPGTNATMTVTVSNKTTSVETFSVVLSNVTTSSSIRTQQVTSLPASSATNVALVWNTPSGSSNYLLRATAGPIAGEAVTDDNSLSATVTVRPMLYDLGLLVTVPPALAWPNTTTNVVTILATNAGDFSETFSVNLYDDTDVRLVSSNQISGLAVAAATNLSVTWRTTNSLYGYHALRAVANPVAGETNLVNNTNLASAVVANGWTTNAFITKASAWRYNDQGLDLSITPWFLLGYYDSVWSQGPGPLGYSESGQFTNLATLLSWGSAATNKSSTYYFRQAFNADALPSSLTLNVRRVDGAILYLNGAELARFNMPTGAIGYANLASTPVSGSDQYTYFSSNALPGNLVLGRNVLAAEVHRADVAGSDLAFDLEMLGVVPQFPPTHGVDAIALTPGGDALAGDNMSLTVTLTNRGNATETVLVLFRNNTTGQILGSQTITELHPGDSPSVSFNWATFGAANGTNQLVAYTVVGGVTNLAGAFTNAAVISGSGFTASSIVNAAASVGGRCSALATTGNRLLVGAGATLEVWDRSNPAVPTKQGAVRLPGLIQSIATSGSYAFVACGQAGVQFVDLTSPSLPIHRSTFNSSGDAHAVAASSTYLYVADGVAGLRIVNIVNPAQPFVVGAYYTQGPARAIALSGPRVFLVDQQQGLLILDAANPAAPALLGSYTSFDSGQSIAVSGGNAYIVDGNNHFLVVDVSTPSTPALAGSLLLANKVGQAVALNGTTIYVAAGGDGLLTIDASAPSAPALTSTIAMPGEAAALAVAGSTLYVAGGFAGFQAFDLTSPGSPVLQADFPTALRAADVCTLNNLAYVAAGESGLQIFSLTNPVSPKLLSRFTGVINARAVAVSGTTAYVGDGQHGLKIVNVANPLAPSLLGSYSSSTLGVIRNVGVSGSLVVVSDGRNLILVDASTPASPSLAGTYSSANFVFSLAAANAKAYLACSSGLVILNMSSGAFSVLGGYATTFPATGISVAGTTAYVAHGTKIWRSYDVSNPASPSIMKSYSAQGPILDLAVAGTNITLITPTNTAPLMDISVPLTPVQTRSFGPLVRAVRLAATTNLTLVAEDEAGLALFASSDDLNHDGIPDWWEQQIVDASSATNGPIRTIYDVRPDDDFDGDGASNHAEYLAGTSPVDSHAVFMMTVQPSTNAAVFNINWFSVAGKTYTIYKSTDLKAGFTVFKDNIPGAPPLNTETDSTTNRAAFYIIGVH